MECLSACKTRKHLTTISQSGFTAVDPGQPASQRHIAADVGAVCGPNLPARDALLQACCEDDLDTETPEFAMLFFCIVAVERKRERELTCTSE